MKVVSVLDESDLCRRFADGLGVHEGRLLDADLDLTVILFAELLKQSPHPRQRHLRRPCLIGHVSRLDYDLHQQLLTSAQHSSAIYYWFTWQKVSSSFITACSS